jgi:hypothetical protein
MRQLFCAVTLHMHMHLQHSVERLHQQLEKLLCGCGAAAAFCSQLLCNVCLCCCAMLFSLQREVERLQAELQERHGSCSADAALCN